MIDESPSNDKENVLIDVDAKSKNMSPKALGQDELLEGADDVMDEIDDVDDVEEESEDSEVSEDDESVLDKSRSVIPPADDFKGIAKRMMKPIPDYPVKDEKEYVWKIKDWSSLKADKVRSPTFKCGGFEWNILLFPRGNNNTHLSIYMEPHPISDGEQKSDDNWYVCAQFCLDIWNPAHPNCHLPSGSSHRFNKNETDWGFSSLIDLKQLHTPNPRLNQLHAILENNQLNITGYVKVIDDSSTGVLWNSFIDYDSKKNTGHVGLNNQGATCYLNSLLQSYYTTKIFRNLVYQIPTENQSNNKSVPLSLQRIFYLLSTSNDTVATLELTKSFGWDSSDAFTQHDVQELNRILMDKLETAMKGTKIENRLNDIFVGKMKSYIKCVDVPYESSRVEDFWDIQLNVKGFKNLEQSFKNYIEIEMLDGENKYQAGDEYGYQDAKKGVVFESFPPVLHLQLKRFEYDFMVDDLVKIDDFYEFPDKIDLSPYLDEDLPDSVKNQNWNYKLHGVLVHQGSISNGHYYAMIKPYAREPTWLRFDDDKVWKVTNYNVFQENFGAGELSSEEFSKLSRLDQQENLIRRVTSAYMLVYYRETDLDKILPKDVSGVDSAIPNHIPAQIEQEIKEKENLEKLKQEALYYTNVSFLSTKNFNSFNGFDLYPDPTFPKFYDESLVDPTSKPMSVKVKKEDSFTSLYKTIGVKLGYCDETIEDLKLHSLPFRLLPTNHRNNHTNRTDAPVSKELESSSINSVYSRCFNRKYDEMVFYVEELNKELHNVIKLNKVADFGGPETFEFLQVADKLHNTDKIVNSEFKFEDIVDHSSHILIFLKYFDPYSQQVKGLTHATVSKDSLVSSLTDPIRNLLGFNEDIQLNYFEELSHSKIEKVDLSSTFEKSEISNGDILTVQVSDVEKITNDMKFKNASDYYRFLLTKLHISVKPYKADVVEEAEDVDQMEEDLNDIPSSLTRNHHHKAFDLWVSTLSSFSDLASEIARNIGEDVDPSYLRIFIVNSQGQRYALKTTHHLSQFFPKTVPVSQVTTFEYEILKITLQEYENLKAVKVYWLNNLLTYQVHELLVPKTGSVYDLMNKLLLTINLPHRDYKNLLLWAGVNHKFYDLIRFDRSIESLNDSFDIYAGVYPAEVEILVSHDMIKRFNNEPVSPDELEDEILKKEYSNAKLLKDDLNLIPAFHFHKSSNYHHGIPFILPVFPDEKFLETKERLRKKLGVGSLAFEKIKFALADDNDKGRYLDHDNDDLILYNEINKSQVQYCFALDHPDRSPRRQNNYDKGISIK
ncbi:uncharacterized protein PRCAT00004887001 [Priceomyces carsonii]|uniref:uncharacterized protein n=1 Tax=Priceomyces carsonii TaxID=28549 RepID=UPI002ED9E983|nr:unnamed protein product [Priceomyces carsonii]